MVCEAEDPVEVESDEEDGDDIIQVNDKCMENDKCLFNRIKKGHWNPNGPQFFHGIRRRATLHDENFSVDRKLIIKKFEASFKWRLFWLKPLSVLYNSNNAC